MCSSYPSNCALRIHLQGALCHGRRRAPAILPAAMLLAGLLLSLPSADRAHAQTSGRYLTEAPDLRTALLRSVAEDEHLIRSGAVSENHSPRGALWRAAVLPGWGQIYNRQYLKLPFVYGAMGGLVAAVISLDNDYDLYNRAFQYKAYQELVDAGQLDENPRSAFQGSYDRIAAEVGPVSSRPLEIRRNNLRRGRDLSAIGLGLVYGLAMLDAYVSAHLLDFDVGEDLGVTVTPGTDGFRISARIALQRTRE